MKKILLIILVFTVFVLFFYVPDHKNVYIDKENRFMITYPEYAHVFIEDNGNKIMFRDNEQGPSYVTVMITDRENSKTFTINYWDGEGWIVEDRNLTFL